MSPAAAARAVNSAAPTISFQGSSSPRKDTKKHCPMGIKCRRNVYTVRRAPPTYLGFGTMGASGLEAYPTTTPF